MCIKKCQVLKVHFSVDHADIIIYESRLTLDLYFKNRKKDARKSGKADGR